MPKASIEKIVNPLGTVTTVTAGLSAEVKTDILDEVVSQLAAEESVIHENCDESLFRPVVAIFCDNTTRKLCFDGSDETALNKEYCKPPEVIGNKLIVPVIAKEVDAELVRKEKQKSGSKLYKNNKPRDLERHEENKFLEFSSEDKRSASRSSLPLGYVAPPRDKVRVDNFEPETKKATCSTRGDETTTVQSQKLLPSNTLPLRERQESESNVRKITATSEAATKSESRTVASAAEVAAERETSESSTTAEEQKKDESSDKPKSVLTNREILKSLEVNKVDLLPAEKHGKQTADYAILRSKGKIGVTESKVNSKVASKPCKIAVKTEGKPSVSDKEAAAKPRIRTENLNMSELADSLIELKDDNVGDDTSDNKVEKKIDNAKKEPEPETVPEQKSEIRVEPVESYTPPKLSKKRRQKQNRSGSSSEAEEIVEVAPQASNNKVKKKSANESKLVEKSPPVGKQLSTSSDDSNTDLVDSVLKSKAKARIPEAAQTQLTTEESTTTEVARKQQQEEKKNVATESQPNNVKSKPEEKSEAKIEANKIASKSSVPEINVSVYKLSASESQTARKDVPETPRDKISKYDGTKSSAKEDMQEELTIKEKATLKETGKQLPKLVDSFDKPKIETQQRASSTTVEVKAKTKSNPSNEEEDCLSIPLKIPPKLESTCKDDKSTESCTASLYAMDSAKLSTTNRDNATNTRGNEKKTVEMEDEARKLNLKDSGSHQEKDESKGNVKVASSAFASLKEKEYDINIAKEVTVSKKYENPTVNEPANKVKQPIVIGISGEEKNNRPASIIKKDKIKTTIKGSTSKFSSSEDVRDGLAVMKKEMKETSAREGEKPKEKSAIDGVPKIVAAEPPPSVWSTLSGAELFSKTPETSKVEPQSENLASMSKAGKGKKIHRTLLSDLEVSVSETSVKPLLELPIPLKSSSYSKDDSKYKKSFKKEPPAGFDDFPLLNPLKSLSPLPPLECLELDADATTKIKETKASNGGKDAATEQISLINFESPLQESLALERKPISPTSDGYNSKNLIFALCGSLHYENESSVKKGPSEKAEPTSPTLSLTRSSSALGEQSVVEYKSLIENEDQYMSLEHSSQETNTTTATTNDKLSSSPNSSASEEIIILEEKKMSKKQRRKKQQMELQKQKEQLETNEGDVDEELRPLINMSDSQVENYVDSMVVTEHFAAHTVPAVGTTLLLDENNFTSLKTISTCSLLTHSTPATTTDSEGPMPATTSDDNLFIMPSASTSATPNKLKTKKLEHKINLIAAIEAATSSSTSSAEESGVDNCGRSSDLDAAVLATSTSSATLPLPSSVNVGGQQGAIKKKTKRRKR